MSPKTRSMESDIRTGMIGCVPNATVNSLRLMKLLLIMSASNNGMHPTRVSVPVMQGLLVIMVVRAGDAGR